MNGGEVLADLCVGLFAVVVVGALFPVAGTARAARAAAAHTWAAAARTAAAARRALTRAPH